MKTIKNKLNSQSGVSILFALLLFLVATVVSLVIIVAATSSIKRETSYKETIQKNIELDSAVLFLSNKINEYSDDKIGGYVFVDDNGRKDYSITTSDDSLKRIIVDISSIVINRDATSGHTEGKIIIKGDNLSDITCSYRINFGPSSSSEIPASISFKYDNGNVVYNRYTFRIDENKITWIYDKASLREVE